MEGHLTDNLLPLKVPVLQITNKVFPPSPKKPKLNTQQLLEKIYSTINAGQSSNQNQVKKSSINNEETAQTPQNVKMKCNCKKSKCLKLYCECFAQGSFCDGCLCEDCENRQEFNEKRAKAIDEIMDRMPLTFGKKITQTKGCNCKKTGCLKKYCECFKAGGKCGQQCKCFNCLNN